MSECPPKEVRDVQSYSFLSLWKPGGFFVGLLTSGSYRDYECEVSNQELSGLCQVGKTETK